MRLLGRRTECEFLDAVLSDALGGQSRVVVLRGEAGVGKTSLLDFVRERTDHWRVATAVGIESEMELAYSGLHQLCAPMLDHLDQLPAPQRSALAGVFGHEDGPPPDRFLIGLATLTLLTDLAEQQPLLCVIDDAQWLDHATAQTLSFVARRVLAEPIALICAARTGVGDDHLTGLPALALGGLADNDARALLLENLRGPLDAAICEQLILESRGNPLALLELPRTWNATEFAGGFGFPAHQPIVGKVEQSFVTRLQSLPAETQLLVLTAAAEPLGDPLLLHRALAVLGVEMVASGPAMDAGLLEVGGRIQFAHPLVRSAAYRSSTADDRHHVHRALAEATDEETDPDRRAWHRARGTPSPDEEVAAELERSAGRAQARGGVAAAAAFLSRAATLSPDPARRAQRALAAAEAKQLAGAPHAAATLLVAAADCALDERDQALAVRLKGQIALDLRRVAEAVPILLDAAGQLEPIEPALARATYLEALRAGSIAGRVSGDVVRAVAEAALGAPRPISEPRAADVLLFALARRFTDGYAASAPLLKDAMIAFLAEDYRAQPDVRWPGLARRFAFDLYDDTTTDALCMRSVELARERGALGVLPLALNYLAVIRGFQGDLDGAEALLAEAEAIAEATGSASYGLATFPIAGLRGDESAVSELAAAVEPVAVERGEGALLTKSEYASALLYNGLGRYEEALAAAARASAREAETFSIFALPELVEAATRCGDECQAGGALEQIVERTQAAGTAWALGIEARASALLSAGRVAEDLYLEAIARLSQCAVAPDRARAHLLYGEWLRREGRRMDARVQLRLAHDALATIGMHAFTERARRELAATGERVRRQRGESRDDLTSQEAQIAGMARDGHSNPEIAAQLFLSSRTVEWHLRKVFGKLGISSRRELGEVLPKVRATHSV